LPFQGDCDFQLNLTQGGARRLRRFALPWADLFWPLRGVHNRTKSTDRLSRKVDMFCN
jgi:hypothetical protein